MAYTTSTDLGLHWADPDCPATNAPALGLPRRVRRAEATEPVPQGPAFRVASALPGYARGEENIMRRRDYSAPKVSE